MKIHLLFLFSILFIHQTTRAQDFPYAKHNFNELTLKVYDKDTSAAAVVIQEFGEARFSNLDRTPLLFNYHVKIKIIKSKGFDQGNIVIPIYKGDNDHFETVSGIQGVTFFQDESGAIKKLELDPKSVVKENKNKNWDLVKFAMPGLKEGCVIEYKYTLESPYRFNFRKWVFQSDIPKIHSEYIARIPATYNYNVSLKGYLKLSKTNAEVEKECFTPGGGIKIDCSKMTYIMNDIPAFVEEAQMTSPENFKSAINFELSNYVDFRGSKHQITQEWSSIDKELADRPDFGSKLKKNDAFKTLSAQIVNGSSSDLDKAKAIYSHFQRWFKWNGFYSIFSENSARKVYDSHTGSVADINLNLSAALSTAGLHVETVLLSTRENGLINKLYPVISDFNYLVCKVNIDGNSYLLDATDALLPFGLLPLRCMNDQGRVFGLNKPSYWIDLKAAQKTGKAINMELALQENGKFKGTIQTFSSGYEALRKRHTIKSFASTEEFVEDYDEKLPKIKILNSKISNLDSLNANLGEVYEVEIDAFEGTNHERFLFNPFIMDKLTENPFKMEERVYPVDMGAASENKIILSIKLPEGYEVTSKIDDVALALPNNGGRFITKFENLNNNFIFSELMQLNKPVYQPEEYGAIKELYNKIIQVQKTDIEFRKKTNL
jgi:hypothetical protein